MVTLDFGSGREHDITTLDAHDLVWSALPDLRTVHDANLRRAQRHVLQETYVTVGLERIAVGTRVLRPLEEEMKRRGLGAIYRSMGLRARSNRTSRAEEN